MPINPKYLAKFEKGGYYHVYNRSHSDKKMFAREENYPFFLKLVVKYLVNYLDFLSYSLLPNHFHFFVRAKEDIDSADEKVNELIVSQFRKTFIAYTNSFNKEYNKHGGIFSTPFRRIEVVGEEYLKQIVYYLHFNAVHHNLIKDFEKHSYSSYNEILSDRPSFLQREKLFALFGGREKFIEGHFGQKENYEKLPFYIER